MQGRIVNSTGGTCRSRVGNWSTIDYFVVSRHLLPAVRSTELVGSEPARPHVPIRLILGEKPRQYRERVLKRIHNFPLFTPYGPSRRPLSWSTGETLGGLTGAARLNRLHTFVVEGIEAGAGGRLRLGRARAGGTHG